MEGTGKDVLILIYCMVPGPRGLFGWPREGKGLVLPGPLPPVHWPALDREHHPPHQPGLMYNLPLPPYPPLRCLAPFVPFATRLLDPSGVGWGFEVGVPYRSC